MNKLAPHVYLVAGAAFRDMVRQNTSQSLVINGESGAGKTETTKKAMQFFAKLAGGTGVEDQVLEVGGWVLRLKQRALGRCVCVRVV